MTSKGYPVTELNTGISFRAYPANFSNNFTSLRSYRTLADLRDRIARAQDRDDAAGRPGRSRMCGRTRTRS